MSTHSITLNGVKATITFQDTKPAINWELLIETADAKASIDGSIINTHIEPPVLQSPVAIPEITEQKEKKLQKYVDECGYTWPAFVGKSDDEARLILMKKLFEKEKLVFTPDIMQIYYNSEVQTVRANRYKKMMLFINAYKNIDGETMYL